MKQSRKTDWALDVIGPVQDMNEKMQRGLRDLPRDVPEGSKQVAQLTAWRHGLDWALQPVMEALDYLQVMPKERWEDPYMAADGPLFDWRTAPLTRYASFEDFYHRELEATWGKWEKLQATYRRVINGDITPEQGKAAILGDREIGIEGGKAGPGRGNKTATDSRRLKSYGQSPDYLTAKLDRDNPELADAVRRGEVKLRKAAKLEDRRIWLSADPVRGAQQIREKFGDEYATALTGSVPITVNAWIAATRKYFTDEQQREIAQALAAPMAGTSTAR